MVFVKEHINKIISNAGIYAILNKVDGKIYIGSSYNIKRRYNKHVWLLNKNDHFNNHLQRAWNKYGADNFEFKILGYYKNNKSIEELEATYILLYTNMGHKLYNICSKCRNAKGVKRSDETKKRLSKSISKYYENRSENEKEKKSINIKKGLEKKRKTGWCNNGMKDKKHTNESKKKISDSLCKRFSDKEKILKLSKAHGLKGKFRGYRYLNGSIINIGEFYSLSEAERKLNGVMKRQAISKMLKGKSFEYKGYTFEYIKENEPFKIIEKRLERLFEFEIYKVFKYDINNNLVDKFLTLREACNNANIKRYETLNRYIENNTVKNGYYWKRNFM